MNTSFTFFELNKLRQEIKSQLQTESNQDKIILLESQQREVDLLIDAQTDGEICSLSPRGSQP